MVGATGDTEATHREYSHGARAGSNPEGGRFSEVSPMTQCVRAQRVRAVGQTRVAGSGGAGTVTRAPASLEARQASSAHCTGTPSAANEGSSGSP